MRRDCRTFRNRQTARRLGPSIMTASGTGRSDCAAVLQKLAQQWRKAAEEIDHPQLKQCYAERARDAAARARAFGAEEDDDQT
jgi:hypothetical protein